MFNIVSINILFDKLIKIKNYNFKSINYFDFIFYFLLISYVIGPAVLNITITILSLYSLYRILKDKIKINSANVFILLIFLYIIIKEIFFVEYFNKDFIGFLRFLFIFLFINSIKIKSYLNFSFLLIFTLLFIFDCFFQYFLGFNILGFYKYEDYRLTSFFDDEPIVGSFLTKIFPILTVFLINSNYLNKIGNYKNFLLIIFIFVYLTTIFITGERMAFIQCFFISIIMLLIFKKFKLLTIMVLFSINTIFLLNFLDKDNFILKRYTLTYDSISNIFQKNTLTDSSIDDYKGNFLTGFEIWNDSKIFGNGYRYYNSKCYEHISITNTDLVNGCSTHPHNIYLEILADHGLVGLLLFVIFFLINLKNIFNSNYIKSKYYGISLTSFILIFPFFTSQSIFSSHYGSLFFLSISMLAYINLHNLK